MSAPRLTIAHVRDLLASPADRPTLYLDHEGEIVVGPDAYASHSQIISTREAAVDYLSIGGDEDIIDDETIAYYLPDYQDTVDRIWAER